MKRTIDKRTKLFMRIWTLFEWRECIVCSQEFRREWGWRWIGGAERFGFGERPIDICRSCCPTLDDAEKSFYIKEEENYQRVESSRPLSPSQR